MPLPPPLDLGGHRSGPGWLWSRRLCMLLATRWCWSQGRFQVGPAVLPSGPISLPIELQWAHQAAHGNWSGSGGLGCTMLLFGLSVALC